MHRPAQPTPRAPRPPSPVSKTSHIQKIRPLLVAQASAGVVEGRGRKASSLTLCSVASARAAECTVLASGAVGGGFRPVVCSVLQREGPYRGVLSKRAPRGCLTEIPPPKREVFL